MCQYETTAVAIALLRRLVELPLRVGLMIAIVAGAATMARSETAEDGPECFYAVPLQDLQITEGALQFDSLPQRGRRSWRQQRAYRPYVALDRGEEGYVSGIRPGLPANNARLLLRAAHVDDVTGTIYLPKPDLSGMNRARFRVPHGRAGVAHRPTFQQVKAEHYSQLVSLGVAGTAWFRHQARLQTTQDQPIRNRPPNELFLQRTFALFSGGRAVSENLQLDRQLRISAAEAGGQVPIDSIEGITVQQIDWSSLIEDATPRLDALARYVPADQHVAFFASFDDAVRVADEFRRNGRWILSLAEPMSQSAEVVDFYERQLCLTLDTVSRALGPTLANSVAVTGSDPYFRTGTDVAVLFESENPELLEEVLLAQVRMMVSPAGLSLEAGSVASLPYYGVRSKDRLISVYIAKTSDLLIVTNSLYQLERLAHVLSGHVPSLVSAPEYVFFRTRYGIGHPEETAFVFLSDATIRRWCGPRWRIATSRRTLDAAVLAELQAEHVDRIADKSAPHGWTAELDASSAAALELLDVGVHHSRSGNLRFMTPLSEIPLEHVSEFEKAAYEQWRDQYQRNWRWAFDPIGIRFHLNDRKMSADITVMPLIFGTQYRQLIDLSQGTALTAESGDPHDALLHYALAINKESELFRRSGGTLTALLGIRNENPLSWLGSAVAVYLDDGRFWDEMEGLSDDQAEISEQLPGMIDHFPLGVYAEVSSGLRLTAFLAGVRAFIEQSAPGMTNWETREHEGQPYVRVSLTERAQRGADELRGVAVYYAPAGDSLTVALDESVLHGALDRAAQRAEQAPAGDDASLDPASQGWAGQNVALRVDRRILDALTKISGESYLEVMQARSWSNLPILNEWKRLFPDKDPVELHRQFWHVALVCPGGGDYVWNDEWQTMESTVYGHPGQPQRGPAAPPLIGRLASVVFGVTFENQGLRATMQLDTSPTETN